MYAEYNPMLDEMQTEQDIKLVNIRNAFKSMMVAARCIVNIDNPIKSMIVTGAAGIGKTYNLQKYLENEDACGNINLTMLNGKCTPMGLYEALYHARSTGDVLLMDDVNVFDNETSLDILKAALDSSDKRYISYQTGSKALSEKGIPMQFAFDGKVIFITNNNLAVMSKQQTKLAPHVTALMTRSTFIDLGIHNNDEIMIHIEDIITSTDIVTKLGLTKNEATDILDFMKKNSDDLITPSLRMPVLIAGLIKEAKIADFDWRIIAKESCTIRNS